MCKKFLRKFEPAFRAIAKKIEPQVKKWFSYKKKKRVQILYKLIFWDFKNNTVMIIKV